VVLWLLNVGQSDVSTRPRWTRLSVFSPSCQHSVLHGRHQTVWLSRRRLIWTLNCPAMLSQDFMNCWLCLALIQRDCLSTSQHSTPHFKFVSLLCLCLFGFCTWNRADHYIFALWFLSFFLLLLSFFSSPNLSGRRLDVYHISTHGVALVRV